MLFYEGAFQVKYPDTASEWGLWNQEKQLLLYSLCKETFNMGMRWDIWVLIWYDDRYYWTGFFCFCPSLSDLDLDCRPQGCEKQKLLCQLIHKVFFQWTRMELSLLMRLWYYEPCTHFISSDQYSKERTQLRWFGFKKNNSSSNTLTWACIQTL